MKNEFTAVIEPPTEDDPWFIAYCPQVPGANGQGKTKEEAKQNLAEGIALMLEVRREEGLRGTPPDTREWMGGYYLNNAKLRLIQACDVSKQLVGQLARRVPFELVILSPQAKDPLFLRPGCGSFAALRMTCSAMAIFMTSDPLGLSDNDAQALRRLAESLDVVDINSLPPIECWDKLHTVASDLLSIHKARLAAGS